MSVVWEAQALPIYFLKTQCISAFLACDPSHSPSCCADPKPQNYSCYYFITVVLMLL